MDHGVPTRSFPKQQGEQPRQGLPAILTRRKPIEALIADGDGHGGGGRVRSLGMWQLTMIGIGANLGTGIFVVLGQAVPSAGPAVVLSFILAGLTALFSALSHTELAGTGPVSGSSYSYA